MPGIEIERQEKSFEMGDRTVAVIDAIKEAREKNMILGFCGNELEIAYIKAQQCNLEETVSAIALVGTAMSNLEEWEREKGRDIGDIMEKIEKAFREDMAELLSKQCGCKQGG